LDQSVRRTAIHQSIDYWQTIKHIFTYPFDNVYHFLPWSLMIVFVFSKKNIKRILTNDFIAFNAILFLANLSIYWVSVEVYPRYILMLAPMIFTVFVYLYDLNFKEKSIHYKVVNILFIVLFISIFIFSLMPYFNSKAQINDYYILKTLFLNISIFILGIIYYFKINNKLILMVLLVLIVRVGYDWFVIPGRYRDNVDFNKQATNIGIKYKDKSIFLYKKSKVDYTASYYIARQRGVVTTREFEYFTPQSFYYFDTSRYDLDTHDFKIVDEFMVREFDRTLFVVVPKREL
jgi:hypothetical protein